MLSLHRENRSVHCSTRRIIVGLRIGTEQQGDWQVSERSHNSQRHSDSLRPSAIFRSGVQEVLGECRSREVCSRGLCLGSRLASNSSNLHEMRFCSYATRTRIRLLVTRLQRSQELQDALHRSHLHVSNPTSQASSRKGYVFPNDRRQAPSFPRGHRVSLGRVPRRHARQDRCLAQAPEA